MLKLKFLIAIILLNSMIVWAQTTSDAQLWLDAELNYTYKQKYLFQDELSYQTLIAGGNKWYSFNSTPAFEYNLNSHFDLISSVPLSYTMQDQKSSTFEIGTMLGTRIYFTPARRPQIRAVIRVEERWSHDLKLDEWNVANRVRIRGEFVYPINKKSYFEDKMWYLISDAEVFLSTTSDIDERFANRTRFRVGVGYRLSYKMRFEGFYVLQFSRNTLNDKFNSLDNIIRLRFKYYLK